MNTTLRFALSTLFLATLLASPAAAQQEKFIAALQKAGGVIRTDPSDPNVPLTFTMGANASDKEFEAVAQLKTIREINVPMPQSSITDRGAAAISNMPELETLHIPNSQVTDAGLAKLKNLKKLKKLNIAGTRVSDKGLALLKDFPALEWIDVGKLNVTANGLSQLAACKNLQTLFVSDHPALTDAVLEKIATLPKLDRLEFARADKVTDKCLASLKKAPLQRLVIVRCKGITDAGVRELKNYPNLNDLEIWECKGVTDKSVPVFEEMKMLKSLKLTGSGVSRMATEQLRKSLPGTAVVN